MKHKMRTVMLVLVGACGLGVASVGAEIYSGNFHEVVPGELYRSAQLRTGDIARYKQQYHIRTVINLRGENPADGWYTTEVREAKAEGVTHVDFRMSASHELSDQQAMQLLEVMRTAPKPLLIHCKSGADRTGLASALYVAGIRKGTEWQAERQMWIFYGHVPFAISAAAAMNRTFERLEPFLGYFDS